MKGHDRRSRGLWCPTVPHWNSEKTLVVDPIEVKHTRGTRSTPSSNSSDHFREIRNNRGPVPSTPSEI